MSSTAWRMAGGAALGLVLVAQLARASKSCVEVSDVVGYEKCRRFGDSWSTERLPPLSLEIGLGRQWFSPSGHDFKGSSGKNGPTLYEVRGDSLGVGALGGTGLEYRLGGYLGPVFLGVGMGWGVGRNPTPTFRAGGYEVAAKDAWVDTVVFHGGLVVGVRVPLGRLSLRAQTTLGGSVVSLSQLATPLGPSSPAEAAGPKSVTTSSSAWYVAPSLLLDVWTTPWSTITVHADQPLGTGHLGSVGVLIGLHARTFDGAFTF